MRKMIKVCDRDIRVEGGLLRIARPHGDGYRFLADPARILEGLRACGTRVDLFTFAQRLPETKPEFPYPVEWDNYAVLPISTFDHWWTKQIGNKTRNMVRQGAKKGLTVREVPFDDALVQEIREIYNESPIRQNRRFPHYGKDLETVRREEASFIDSSIFIGAFFDGKLIGFVKLVTDETRTQAGLMNILSMLKHRDKAPQNALIAHAVRECANRRIPYLVYSKFDYGKGRNDSLRDFKERNGFNQVDTPRYFVPMTSLGWSAFRLRLHHRFAERVPEPLAAKFRELRAAWYARRYRSLTEAF